MTPVQLLAFELFERIVRLRSHIHRSCQLASIPGARSTAQLKIAADIQSHLKDVARLSFENIRDDSHLDEETKLQYLHKALEHLSSIHTQGLVRIPRPHEPVELMSYLRQMLLAENDVKTDVSTVLPEIFATEGLGHQVHYRFALAEAIKQLEIPLALNDSLVDFANNHGLGNNDTEETPSETSYVSLPRIDLGNPCRWPSVMHEAGHIRISRSELWSRWEKHVDEPRLYMALNCIRPYTHDNSDEACRGELSRWLLECWCDAFAVIHSGPAAFFSQLHAFIFSHPSYLTTPVKKSAGYPPAWFRLKLLLTLSEARLDNGAAETKDRICVAMEEEKNTIFALFGLKVPYLPELVQLLHLLADFLRDAFPRDQYSLNTSLSSLTLQTLLNDLGQGLPIPSIVREGNIQRATSPAEILLAGWIHRCTRFKQDFMELLAKTPTTETDDIEQLLKRLQLKVDRSDETLKRSIQMAEWFKILNEGGSSELIEPSATEVNGQAGPLSDRDIGSLLSNGELRIIPLIDAGYQVRGSVIDLRLGHNFEIFSSNVPRIIDPMAPQNSGADSMEVDVDFLRGIQIGPGQFILAHTLEYLKLPNDVAAQIEGRSSFARLGLQVHMTANLVEAGFDGCLTLEIANSGPSTITLYPGMRIAQLRFFRLVTPPKYPYGLIGDTKYRGRLSHNKAQQFSDWEVSAIERAKKKFGII